MQQIGRVQFRVDHNGMLTELGLLQVKNGITNYVSLDKERHCLNLMKRKNITKILTIEQIGDKHYTDYKTLPGRHNYTKEELKRINAALLKRLKGTGRQKMIILF